MSAPSPEGADARRGLLGRRRLLWLAGAGGLGAAAASIAPRWLGAETPSPSPTTLAPANLGSNVVAAPAAPPAAPSLPPAPTAVPASGVMLCRDAWRAQPALPGGVTHKLSRMTLHHTGAVLGDNTNAPG